MHSEWTCSLI